jgi:hypothetical protein
MAAIDNSGDLFRRSYRQGWIIFSYGLVWFIALAAGFNVFQSLLVPGDAPSSMLLAAAVVAALAGGIGGTTAMWQRLARHLVIEQNLSSHSLFSFLIQPLTGLIAGVLSLLLLTLPGTLLVNYATTRTLGLADLAASSTFVALLMLLAWVAGYYHQIWLAKWRSSPGKEAPSQALVSPAASSLPSPPPIDSISDSPLAFQVWVEQRQRMIRWSLLWGGFILIYGLAWLIGLLGGFVGSASLFPSEAEANPPLVNLLAAGWPAILAGGMGGVIGMLYDLYHRVSFVQDFDRQHIIASLILPLTGLVLGGAMYLFIASGYLSLKSLVSEAPPVVDVPAIIAIYIVLGWVAGFRQQSLHGLIRRLIQTVLKFLRFCRSLLSPKLLWDQAERTDALSEIAKQRELFRSLDRDKSSSAK